MGQVPRIIKDVSRRGTQMMATVLSTSGDRATVRLSGNGAVYTGLRVVGGPVAVGQTIRVDMTTDPPNVVAPGVDYTQPVRGGGRINQRVFTAAQAPAVEVISTTIDVFDGPAPTTGRPVGVAPKASYDATHEGLVAAIEDSVTGDVIYIPACTIEGNHFIPSQTDYLTKRVSSVTIIGAGANATILSGELWLGNSAYVKDLQVNASGSGGFQGGIYLLSNAFLENVKVIAIPSDESGALGITNWFSAYLWAKDLRVNSSGDGIIANIESAYGNMIGYAPGYVGYWTGGAPVNNGWIGLDGTTGKIRVIYQPRTPPVAGNYLYDFVMLEIPGQSAEFPAGSKIHITATVIDGPTYTTSGSPWWVAIQDPDFYYGVTGGSAPFDEYMMAHADDGPPEFLSGSACASFTEGDTIEWVWENLLDYRARVRFYFTRYCNYENPAPRFEIEFQEMWVEDPNHIRTYLFPAKLMVDLVYSKVHGDSIDLNMEDYGLARVANTVFDTWTGAIIWMKEGEIPVYYSSVAPQVTYLGMFWLEE